MVVHSTVRKYPTLWKFGLHFVYIFRTDWNFLTKFDSSDPGFKSIWILLQLKFKTPAHASIVFIH